MNKILIALVLAVVMSAGVYGYIGYDYLRNIENLPNQNKDALGIGNAHAGVIHLFCSNDYGTVYGYAIESNQQSNSLIYYNSKTDGIDTKEIITEWSDKYITFYQRTNNSNAEDGLFRISRENLDMVMKPGSNYLRFDPWGQCELLDGETMLYAKVRKFLKQKQKNNKF